METKRPYSLWSIYRIDLDPSGITLLSEDRPGTWVDQIRMEPDATEEQAVEAAQRLVLEGVSFYVAKVY